MTETDLGAQLLAAFQDLFESMARGAPRVVVGIALAILAWMAAKALEKLLRAVCGRIGLDALAQRAGVDQALGRLGLRQPLSWLLPRTAFYLLLFLLARTAADGLGLAAISSAIGSFLAYLPNLAAALLLVIVGSVVAPLAGGAVTRAASESGIENASSLGRVVSAVVFFVLGIMAVAQLQIDTEVVRLVTGAALAGLSLAFGLSFGLGTREITRNMIAGFYARKIFEVGRPLEIRGERGVLRSITPTQTLLEQDNRVLAVSNAVFLGEVVKQDTSEPTM